MFDDAPRSFAISPFLLASAMTVLPLVHCTGLEQRVPLLTVQEQVDFLDSVLRLATLSGTYGKSKWKGLNGLNGGYLLEQCYGGDLEQSTCYDVCRCCPFPHPHFRMSTQCFIFSAGDVHQASKRDFYFYDILVRLCMCSSTNSLLGHITSWYIEIIVSLVIMLINPPHFASFQRGYMTS